MPTDPTPRQLVARAPFEHAEQRSFLADRTAVRAALDELAHAFALKPGGEDTWVLGARKPDVQGTLELGKDGERTTLVLRVAPNFPWYTLRHLQIALRVGIVGLWLGLGLFLWLGVRADFFTSFGLTAIAWAILEDMIRARVARDGEPARRLAGAAILALARWRSRPGRRWIVRWHTRFWPALTARLAGPGR